MMSTETRTSEFFVAGGTLRPDTPSYVERPTDDELFDRALNGEFCYVLTPRQMGKSSLMIRTARRLGERGVKTVIIDLTRIGVDVSVEQWYLSLLTQLKRRLRLSTDPLAWWHERAALGHVGRFTDFIRDVILAEIEEKIVIFIDEIDTTLNLDFRDDFFAAIRAMYNARAEDPEFDRLTFVLLGVASPPDLIKDRARTPFNIGHGIALQGFSRADAAVLQDGLEAAHPEQGKAIFTRIYHWTNGHPYLTQRLCLAVAESSDARWTNERVDEFVQRLFLSEEAQKEANLKFVQDKILTHSQRRELLKLYKRVVRKKKVGDDGQSPMQNQLKLSGLVKAENGYLRVCNEIYRRKFNPAWVRKNSQINWAPIVAGISIFIVLLLVGSLVYNSWIDIRVQDSIASFYQTNDPEEQLDHLARIFGAQRLFGPTDYGGRARELFFGLSRDEQFALFEADSAKGSNLVKVIRRLYATLADVDDTGSTTPLLEAMVRALNRLDKTNEITRLRDEINSWLEGRYLAKDNQYDAALEAYSRAIELSGKNPATRYERAKILTELSKYPEALSDLDQIMAIARSAPAPTSTPPPSTDVSTPALPSTVSLTALPVPTMTSAETPGTSTPSIEPPHTSVAATPVPLPMSTETPTPEPTSESDPFISKFINSGQMRSAVRNLIYNNSDLVSLLASDSSLEYPNLQQSGLVPTPDTSTATPTNTPINTPDLTATSEQVTIEAIIQAASALPPTPTSTPCRSLLPAPVAPQQGASFDSGDVTFQWEGGNLCSGYVWQVILDSQPGPCPATTENQVVCQLPPGEHQWQIELRTRDAQPGSGTMTQPPWTINVIAPTQPAQPPPTPVSSPTSTAPPCAGGALRLDAWSVGKVCTSSGWTANIFVQGHGGNCLYTYAWENQVQGGPMTDSMTFEVRRVSFGASIVGRASVTSAGETVGVPLLIAPPSCP